MTVAATIGSAKFTTVVTGFASAATKIQTEIAAKIAILVSSTALPYEYTTLPLKITIPELGEVQIEWVKTPVLPATNPPTFAAT